MKKMALHILDSDIFITAKNLYYAFDICPGFWKKIIHHHHGGSTFSLDRVRSELLMGNKTEDLYQWVKKDLPDSFFLSVESEAVTREYEEVMLWANRNPQYLDNARAKFASGADGWLVAYASVHGAIVVTNEQPAPGSKREIKLPDVCEEFEVEYKNTFALLRDLGIKFE